MSFATEFKALAELLEDAATKIALGIEGSFADEESQHPLAKPMRSTEARCRKKAAELRSIARAVKPFAKERP